MKTLKIRKKGLFFTVSIIFLIPAIITIWTLANVQVNMEQSFIIDRIYDLSTSVESCIKEIFYQYHSADVIIEKSDTQVNITFIENISGEKDTWGEEFNNVINQFKNFVESEEPNIDINVTSLQEKETPYVINPYNITYSREWGTGLVSIKVTPQTVNFNSYDVVVNSSNLEIDNVSFQFRNPGNFSFSVTAMDNYGNNIINKSDVDPGDNHQVQIFFVGGNKVKITLISNELEIWTNTPNNIFVSTKIDGLNRTEERPRISIFNNVINVSFPEFKAEKIGSVEIVTE